MLKMVGFFIKKNAGADGRRFVHQVNTSPVEGDSFSPRQMRYLRRGMTGEDVRALQLLLIGRGYGVGNDGADGDFGRATLAALVAYQQDKGLDADGELGPDTLARLISG